MIEQNRLEAHPFLSGLPDPFVRALTGCAREVSFPEGSLVLREGGDAGTFYLVTSGSVALEIHVPGRGPVQVESLHGGDILGLHWFFPPRRWVLDARVVTELHAFALDAACVRARLDEDPALGYAFTTRLLEQLYSRLERARLQRLDVYKAET
jgi:CRP/FNR family cyclic AMP-dependent transcriptional regulator